MRWWVKTIAAVLLWLAPRRFRRDRGDAIRQWVDDASEAAATRGGTRAWLRLTTTIGGDGMKTIVREWRNVFAEGTRGLTDLSLDVRFALRAWARRPGFALLAIGTLGLGVGAVTTSYGIVDAVILSPLPYPESQQLARVGQWSQENPERIYAMSYLDMLDLEADPAPFEAVSGSANRRFNLLEGPLPEAVRGALVTPGFWDTMGVPPRIGRAFSREEFERGERVVVLSGGFWRTRFGADEGILERSITLDGQPYQVVGIMPDDFLPPQALSQQNAVMWAPLSGLPEALRESRENTFISALGRLPEGGSLEAARSGLTRFGARIRAEHPDVAGDHYFGAQPLLSQTIGNASSQLLPLVGTTLLLLLIACTNVASLLMVRATERTRELSVRAAIGAGRARLLQQLLTESVLLGVVGGLVGAALAWGGVEVFARLNPGDIPRLAEVTLRPSGLLFSLAVALATSLVFGLAPALVVRRMTPSRPLRGQGSGSASRGTSSVRGGLIALEAGLALMAVMGAGLLVNSYARLSTIDPGFDAEDLYTMNLDYVGDDDPGAINAYHTVVRQELEAIPGVQSVGATWYAPLGGGWGWQSLNIRGVPPREGDRPGHPFRFQVVGGDFLAAMGIPVVRGRGFDDTDVYGTPGKALVNEAFAEWIEPHGDAIGTVFDLGESGLAPGSFEVVGVIGDIRQYELTEPPEPEIYFALPQTPSGSLTWVVKHAGGPGAALTVAMREAVARVTTDVPPRSLVSMERRVAASIDVPRFYMRLLAGLAAITLALALVGVYGTLSFTFSQSVSEVGIRRALGATEDTVSRHLLRRGLVPVAVGLALGAVAVLPATRLLSAFLYGVAPGDPATLAAAVVLLGVTAGLASWLPALRAARADPMTALREG